MFFALYPNVYDDITWDLCIYENTKYENKMRFFLHG